MKNHKDSSHTPNELLSEMQALIAEAESMMTGTISDRSSEAISNLRERFSAAQERFSDAYAGAKKRVVAGAKAADETIRENPYQSIAVAHGIGVLLGVLVGRRSK
jgi:ElaB/YqjD/DUF883 family membrane-anchored ribosome-binding protein